MSTGETRILVVEDDAELLRMISKLLADMGEVITASDGLQAWDLLQEGPAPSLVITDLMMPGMDGITLSLKMKEERELARVPIIMLTAKGTPRDVINGINAGARHYITKPFKQAELLEKVSRALGRR
jgi:DNA-binding response OmpR family regulator